VDFVLDTVFDAMSQRAPRDPRQTLQLGNIMIHSQPLGCACHPVGSL